MTEGFAYLGGRVDSGFSVANVTDPNAPVLMNEISYDTVFSIDIYDQFAFGGI